MKEIRYSQPRSTAIFLLIVFASLLVLPNGSTARFGSGPSATSFPRSIPSTGILAPQPTAQQGNCLQPPADMVAWLPGDGDTLNLRDTVNGTFSGGGSGSIPLFAPAGKVGQGFNIESLKPGTFERFVDVPSTPNNTLTQALTIDAWIKPLTITGVSERAIVAREGNTAFGNRAYAFSVLDGGKLQMIVYGRAAGLETFRAVVTNSAVISTGIFTHVAASFDAGTQAMKIYVNGVDTATTLLNGSANISSIFDPTIGAAGFQIGTLFDRNKSFDGIIDEVELFRRAITASEILAIFNADSAGKCKPANSCGSNRFFPDSPNALPVSPNLMSSASGDFNGDGNSDLAVINASNANSNIVAILFGRGDGTFDPAVSFPLDGVVRSLVGIRMAVADFNKDGISDLAVPRVSSTNPGDGLIAILLGSSTGMLTKAAPIETPLVGRTIGSLNTGDFNSDGKVDIAALRLLPAQPRTSSVQLLTGDGTGGFPQTTVVAFPTGDTEATDIVIGDFNQDGKLDVVTNINHANGGFSVLLGDGAGSLGPPPTPQPQRFFLPFGDLATSISAADFDGDGKLDLFVPGGLSAGCCASGHLFIYRGDGTGNFTRQLTGDLGRPGGGPAALADFSGDGKPDIALPTDAALFVFLNGSTSTSGSSDFVLHSTTRYPPLGFLNLVSSSVGDFNHDGKPDVASANGDNSNVSVFLSSCTGQTGVDLAILKTANPAPAAVSQNLTYSISVTNNSTTPATGVTVIDTLPASVTFVTATASQGTCTGTSTVTCSLGNLAGGANAALTVVVQPTALGTITNSASVSCNETETNLTNNTTTQVTTVSPPLAADLAITQTDSPDPVAVGSDLTYTINVTNNGPSPATAVTVTDPLPQAVTFVSAPNCSLSAGTVTCSLGNLASGASATRTIVVRPTAVGFLSNTVSVTGNPTDPNAGNNTATQNTAVDPPLPTPMADLAITKTDSPDPVAAGSDLTYTINVSNNGPSPATAVTVTDPLPQGVTFVSAPNCSFSSGTVTCIVGNLASGANATRTIAVRPTAVGFLTNTASVTGTPADPNPGNNTATQNTAVDPPTLSISGGVASCKSISGISGVTLTLDAGGQSVASTTTDSMGRYSFNNLVSGQTYSVTPLPLSGKTFVCQIQGCQTINNLSGNQTANFTETLPPPPTTSGKIAFSTDRDGNNEIYVMNADGTGPINVSNNPASDVEPAWSPDGTKLTFVRCVSGTCQIFVMNAGGSNQLQLTVDPLGARDPAWSPDGTKIAFERGSNVLVMNPDGSNQTQLTNGSDPNWSPDSTKIVFSRTNDIFLMNKDGSNITQLTTDPAPELEPSWSPDGASIAFVRSGEIFVMNGDGSNQTFLTAASGGRHPTWSPESATIAFGRSVSTNSQIFVMSANGCNQARLVATNSSDLDPAWQAATLQISGRVTANGNGLNATVNLSGSESRQIQTSADGSYSLANLAFGGNYTVTPFKTNFTFAPVNRTFNNLSVNQTNQDFSGTTSASFKITGVVKLSNGRGQSGVTVSLSGQQTGTVHTQGDGAYGFQVPAGGNYTVTPAQAGFTFNPLSRTFNDLSGDRTSQNFTALPLFAISGRAFKTVHGVQVGFGGVIVTLTGAQTRSAITDQLGFYSFANLVAGGNYTVTPSAANFVFTPPVRTYTNLNGNRSDQDFTSTLNRFSISGNVTNCSGQSLSGVTLVLHDATNQEIARTLTVSGGSYSFANLVPSAAGYKVTPIPDNFLFTPTFRTFNNTDPVNQTGNFCGAPPPGLKDRIVFASKRDGNFEIYIMNADGSNQTRLTNTPAGYEDDPELSPDGKKIVFRRDASRQINDPTSSQILVMNADGSNVQQLTTDTSNTFNKEPTWSPDGTKIAFTRAGGSPFRSDIWRMNADGSNKTKLSTNALSSNDQPSWSPDGAKIAFSNGNSDIYVMNADGSSQLKLTTNSASDFNPSWSPNGQKIAFASRRDALGADGNAEIYVMDAGSGNNQTRLTTLAGFDSSPTWSPDGTKIASHRAKQSTAGVSPTNPDSGIYVMNADGTGRVRLTSLSTDITPDWGAQFSAPTAAGTNVGVQLGDTTIGYSNVVTPGVTSIDAIAPVAAGPIPTGYATIPGAGVAFDITTTATFSGPITMCFKVPSITNAAVFAALRILHGENGVLVDRTVLAPDTPSPNFTTKTICARVLSLSPFAFAQVIDPTLPKISGRVVDANLNGVGGIALGLDGTQTGATETDIEGNFTFVNLAVAGDYSVTAADVRFTFSPAGQSFFTLDESQAVLFIATPVAAAPAALVQFAALASATEDAHSIEVAVTRLGSNADVVTVNYATANGTASDRADYITTLGTLNFAPGESIKTFPVLISDDVLVEGNETLSVSLSNPAGASLGSTNTMTVTIIDNDTVPPSTNPLDDAQFFVRQHYLDFLSREPDAGGLTFWTNEITSCGANPGCIEVKRINASAAFFLSIEFQNTGYLVERVYKTAYGDATGNSTFGGAHQLPVPMVRFLEFLSDTQQITKGVIVLQPGWEQQLEANKVAFFAEFVQRARFTTAFPTTMTPAEFVDRLNQNAGNVLSAGERTTAINSFAGAGNTTNNTARAQALRQVAEDQDLQTNEFNRAFVLMQYFGYLRRNPNDPQDIDHTGYDFWLTKLNQFNGNFINAEMVKAFITSSEYRQRFGP